MIIAFIDVNVFRSLYWAPEGKALLGLSLGAALLGGFTNTLYLVSMFAVITTHFGKHSCLVIVSIVLWQISAGIPRDPHVSNHSWTFAGVAATFS